MNRYSITATSILTMGLVMMARAEVNPGLAVPASEEKVQAGAATSVVAPTGVSVGSSLDEVRVYPNPWRNDKHAGKPVTFDHLPAAATIKLFSLAGQFVRTLGADDNGVAAWDLTNDAGDKVASGIYLYLISTDDGQDQKGKLAIIH